ncbi:MAG: metallophosphoesterase [Kiritimatiellae bacterium]|nr:metallophosphoesterase [Kiritimatiellia bacterium]
MKQSRRDFLAGAGMVMAGVAASAGHAADAATGASAPDGREGVRFLAFADIHYSAGGFWPHASQEWLDRVLDRAVSSRSDFVMSLGDFTFGPARPQERDYVAHYNGFKPVKTYHTYGNHEFENVTPEVLDEVYGLKSGYYSFDLKGFRFVVLDPHWYLKDGKYHRFYKRCSYPELTKQKIPTRILPPDQMEWLRKTIIDSPLPCVVFSHESLERGRSGINNRAEVRAIFAEANARRPGTVRLAINGHEHKDYFRMLDGVAYLDLNSASYDVASPHNAYPEEFRKRCGSARHIITWNDPINAVITLTPSGGMKIEGMTSTYYLGVTPEMAGWGCDPDGRVTSPKVQSVDMKINYS